MAAQAAPDEKGGGQRAPQAVERALERWLSQRGLEREDLQQLGARIEHAGRFGWSLVFPYLFSDGSPAPNRLLVLEGKDAPAWRWSGGEVKGAVLALGDLYSARLVVIAEGESDGLRAFGLLHEADPSIAVLVIPGSSMVGGDLANRVGNGATVVVATDGDEAGDRCAAECARVLMAAGCEPHTIRRLRPEVDGIERPDLRDLIDALMEEGGGTGEAADLLIELLQDAPQMAAPSEPKVPGEMDTPGGEPEVDTWAPVVDVYAATSPPAPPMILRSESGGALIYAGKRHLLSGEPETLKSWIGAAATAEQVGLGHAVVWVDADGMGPGDLLERLEALGADRQSIEANLLFIAPDRKLDEPGRSRAPRRGRPAGAEPRRGRCDEPRPRAAGARPEQLRRRPALPS